MMRLTEIQIYNQAPFDNLHLTFDDSNVLALSGINGAGKTTILSYIVDSFYELAKEGFANEFEGVSSKYYRVSSPITVLDNGKLSFVYLRYIEGAKTIDYIEIRNVKVGNEAQYAEAVQITTPIAFTTITKKVGSQSVLKYSTITESREAEKLFDNNLLTYFPAYRYEQPGYLNDPYRISLDFQKTSKFSGYLSNPVEVTSNLPEIANWIMDVVLDMFIYKGKAQTAFANLNNIITALLKSKVGKAVRLGVGPRTNGATRISIVNSADSELVYPSIFYMSSGELALLSLFSELTKQADRINKGISDVSGIVLIDEIDKHLHIKLQKETLPTLLKLFPNVQFIVTSHSPFLALGLDEAMKGNYKLFDLDNKGISCTPQSNELFAEVYEMMIDENNQFARKYQGILAELLESRKPLVITEGKTDWKHLKAAMTALDIQDMPIEVLEYEYAMGDETLMKLLHQVALVSPSRKIIGMFDRDKEDVCNRTTESDAPYVRLANNVYAFSIPIANEQFYGRYTSIEHYYPRNNLLNEDAHGRRLFLGEEFYESGISKCKTYFTKSKGIQNKVKVNGVIDEKVYKLIDDPELKTSVALSKDDFAQMILEQNEYASGFDFSQFEAIFAVLKEILAQ